MIIIPPPSRRSARPASQHDTTVGMLVVACLMLGIALFIFIAGPRSHNPPPPLAGFVVIGIGLLFGIISFFSWMKEQGEGSEGTPDNHSTEN